MSLQRGFDGAEPLRHDHLEGPREIRRVVRGQRLATGTLACPHCDAPVHPGPVPLAPAAGLGCPFCGHAGVLRDFLSLAAPSRPARVEVRVVPRARS